VRRGRADATGIPPGSVDAVVLRHVLAHNGGSEQRILNHLASLVRPGGRVYLLDVDLAGTAQGPSVAGELQERYLRWHRNRGNDPRVGRRLGELARRAGLTVLQERGWTVRDALPRGVRGPAWAARDELVRAGLATAADVRRWDAAFAKLDKAPERPEYSVKVFAVVGRRSA
jgi:SAM-dependent methyltransferase